MNIVNDEEDSRSVQNIVNICLAIFCDIPEIRESRSVRYYQDYSEDDLFYKLINISENTNFDIDIIITTHPIINFEQIEIGIRYKLYELIIFILFQSPSEILMKYFILCVEGGFFSFVRILISKVKNQNKIIEMLSELSFLENRQNYEAEFLLYNFIIKHYQ